jgi:Immunoglobulin I-set domain
MLLICLVPAQVDGIVPDYMELVVGETVTLKCVTSGDPSPKVRWLRVPFDDDETVNASLTTIEESNADDRVSVDGGLLVIKNVTLDDEGMYVCEAENTVGKSHRNASLDVLG